MTPTPPTIPEQPGTLAPALTFTADATVTRADGTTDTADPAPADGPRGVHRLLGRAGRTFARSTDRGVVVVPSSAIQSGQTGTYVFVVGADQVAKIVPVTVDRTTDREAIVREGLAGGESVVTDGQSRLGAASKVVVKPSLEAAADAAAKAPARPQS